MIFRHALVHRFIPIAQTSEWYSYFDNEVLVSCRIQNIRYIYIGRNAVGRGRQQHPCDIFAGLAEILIVHLKMISLCPQADQIAEAVCCEERTFFRRIIYLRTVRVKQGITVTKRVLRSLPAICQVPRQAGHKTVFPDTDNYIRCSQRSQPSSSKPLQSPVPPGGSPRSISLRTRPPHNQKYRRHLPQRSRRVRPGMKIRMLVKKCFQHRNHIVSANEIVSAIIRIFCRRFSVFIKHKRSRHAISIAHRVVA